MANTTKKATVNKSTKSQEDKKMSKAKKVVEVTETVEQVAEVKKANKEKVAKVTIPQLDNDGMKKLFQDNGCSTHTNANNASNVVYNTFGTKSRVLQQGKAYQLLLTNGHKKVKEQVVECENDDAARFTAWYETLTDEQKGWVSGYSEMMNTKLSASEMPRERTVKITNYDLLVQFIKHMATFDENKLVVSAQ